MIHDKNSFGKPLDPKHTLEVWEVGDEGPEELMCRGDHFQVAAFAKTGAYYGDLCFGETVFGLPVLAMGNISLLYVKKVGSKSYSELQQEDIKRHQS